MLARIESRGVESTFSDGRVKEAWRFSKKEGSGWREKGKRGTSVRPSFSPAFHRDDSAAGSFGAERMERRRERVEG